MPKTSWTPPTIGVGSRDINTPAPTTKPTMRSGRETLTAERRSPRRPAGAGVLLSREAPKNCLPGGDCVATPDKLGLCEWSLSACLGVRLCRSSHQIFRSTNIGGDGALVQTCNKTVMVYKRLTIFTVTVAMFQQGNINQRLRPAYKPGSCAQSWTHYFLSPITLRWLCLPHSGSIDESPSAVM